MSDRYDQPEVAKPMAPCPHCGGNIVDTLGAVVTLHTEHLDTEIARLNEKADHGGYCNLHGRHLGYKCPECPYEDRIAELEALVREIVALDTDQHPEELVLDMKGVRNRARSLLEGPKS